MDPLPDSAHFENRTPSFESIRRETPDGTPYWSARDLMPLLGYEHWHRFSTAIDKAKAATEKMGHPIANHFYASVKVVARTQGGGGNAEDYCLSRLACYLIAMNGNPRFAQIAAAQQYFAIQTRRQELADQTAQDDDEEEVRIALRDQVAEQNRHLATAAMNVGVGRMGRFHAEGSRGFYDGLSPSDLRQRRGLSPSTSLIDHMGRMELAAIFFKATQTEERLARDGRQGEDAACNIHRTVSKAVREFMIAQGNPAPEDLQVEPSIRTLKAKRKQRNRPALETLSRLAMPTLDLGSDEYDQPRESEPANEPDFADIHASFDVFENLDPDD